MRIASAANGHCLDHGLSIMRLALGYDIGLPIGWSYGPKKYLDSLYSMLSCAFPDHLVRVWHVASSWMKVFSNVHYMGEDGWQDIDLRQWLTAFAYRTPGTPENLHFVVGSPDQPLLTHHFGFVVAVCMGGER